MRIRFWSKTVSGVGMEGPPWIEHKTVEGEDVVKLSLTGPSPNQSEIRVVFTREEWPVIKDRIDVAFAGENPNQSPDQSRPYSFWSGKASVTE